MNGTVYRNTHLVPFNSSRGSTSPWALSGFPQRHNLFPQSLVLISAGGAVHTELALHSMHAPRWVQKRRIVPGVQLQKKRVGANTKRCLSRHSDRPWQGVSGTAILYLSLGSGLCHVCIVCITCQRQKDIQGKQHETCLTSF